MYKEVLDVSIIAEVCSKVLFCARAHMLAESSPFSLLEIVDPSREGPSILFVTRPDDPHHRRRHQSCCYRSDGSTHYGPSNPRFWTNGDVRAHLLFPTVALTDLNCWIVSEENLDCWIHEWSGQYVQLSLSQFLSIRRHQFFRSCSQFELVHMPCPLH